MGLWGVDSRLTESQGYNSSSECVVRSCGQATFCFKQRAIEVDGEAEKRTSDGVNVRLLGDYGREQLRIFDHICPSRCVNLEIDQVELSCTLYIHHVLSLVKSTSFEARGNKQFIQSQ